MFEMFEGKYIQNYQLSWCELTHCARVPWPIATSTLGWNDDDDDDDDDGDDDDDASDASDASIITYCLQQLVASNISPTHSELYSF